MGEISQSFSGGFWAMMTIVGPILLALVMIVAMVRNRRSKAEKDRTEDAVRRQHEEERRKEGLGSRQP